MVRTHLHVEVDEKLARPATATLASAGLTISDALPLTLEKAADGRAFPAQLRDGDHIQPIEELDCVRLLADVLVDGGVLLSGTLGAVVHRYRDGVAFEVEFTAPFQALLTLRPEEIVLSSG